MTSIANAAAEFLANKRIAVTGVSRNPGAHAANAVYNRLKERGYEVFAVNPNTTEVEGDPSYPDLTAIPGGVDAVVIGTAPDQAPATVQQCIDLGVDHVWFHRGPGRGSANPEAAELGRANGLAVIDGGCPCMFAPTADMGHRIMRPILQLTGNVPRHV
ncbi:MAG: CoA-binding protein [Acidimicrobiia bacterium]|nr:CoA-binding protein [Acidimicrobiia bacterium]